MGKPPVRDVKSNIRRGGKHPADLEVERADAKVNSSESSVDGSAQEAPKPGKRTNEINESDRSWLESFGIKRSLTDYEQEARDVPLKEIAEAPEKSSDGYSMSKEELDVTMESLKKLYNSLESKPKKELTEAEKGVIKLLDTYKAAGTGTGFLNKLQKAATEGEKTSNEKAEPTNEETIKSLIDRALKAEKQAKDYKDRIAELEKNAKDTPESKVDNSAKAEETVTPETGEAKVEGEPEVKTEQATQEPAKETNTRPGTGEVDEANMMTPEEAFKYLKDNYNDASYAFKNDPTFNSFVDSVSGKWLPRGYFDAYSAKDGIDPKKFTFEHFKAKIPDNLREVLSPEKATKARIDQAKAAENYDKEYENYNTGFKAYLRRHPKLSKLIKGSGALGVLYGLGQMFNDAYTAGQNDKDKHQTAIESLDDDAPEPWVNNGNNNSTEDITKKLKDANTSEEAPEGDSGTIEQAIAEQAPAGNAEPENPQVAANAATPTNTKANNAPASTAKPAPTQGLPPVVTRNTPSTNPDSSGMTYSQRVESGGKAPQAGSMAYNANNPDMVTAGLIDAMNQNSQAGSDAIGYGDLYDQNFIDFWAKRNPNLAFGVSQGRK